MKIAFDDNATIDRGSWLQLMGVREEHVKRADSDEKMRTSLERLEAQMEEAEGLLFDAADPGFTYAVIEAGVLPVPGESLAKHLEGCGQMVVMAVTLGHEVDRLITETQGSRIAMGVVIDSGASVLAEMAAEAATERIRQEIAGRSSDGNRDGSPLFMTGRFSPGYGDSPLDMQKQVLELLDAERQLGITLSAGFMMRPSKSITAIMGLADHPVTGRLATCAECVLRDKCQLRKEGKRCDQKNI